MGSAMLVTTPADAFQPGRIHHQGKPETDDQVEVIDPLPYRFRVSVRTARSGHLTNASALWTNRDELRLPGKAG